MSTKPQLIAFDMDGTLSESREKVTPEMASLFATLITRVPVAIMTGGSLEQIEIQLLSRLPKNVDFKGLYLFPLSATQYYAWQEGAWQQQYSHTFSEQEKLEVRSAIESALTSTHYPTPPRVWGEQVQDHETQITFRALGTDSPLSDRQEWARQHEPERLQLQKAIANLLPQYMVATGGMVSIDITKKDINKAYGVRYLHETTGIPIAEMLFIGDGLGLGGNDGVVIETGIPTYPVSSPTETFAFIQDFIHDTE